MTGSLFQYERYGYVNDHAVWLIQASSPISQMKQLQLAIDSKVFIMMQDQDIVSVKEAYRIAKDYPIILNPIGIWSPMSGLVMTVVSFWERRKDLQGLSFTVATAEVYLY